MLGGEKFERSAIAKCMYTNTVCMLAVAKIPPTTPAFCILGRLLQTRNRPTNDVHRLSESVWCSWPLFVV